MAQVEKSVLVAHSAPLMFELVDRVEDYPLFLPWCPRTEVRCREAERVVATIHIDYHHLKQSFTTENVRAHPRRIEMRLKEGPFRVLEGSWQFHALGDEACKVEFRLHYEFATRWIENIVNPVFSMIAGNLVEAFVLRAERISRG
ncbi:type II toxin-antitoxin system RatA family toxin [Thiobacter aerophilum]|uniref:Type II toxin-antitoxin system RatA family toxin n=1 Tax=Thiobacter aerophilum TaxID=3121275 RepID=A0ABV0EKR7_9BURK